MANIPVISCFYYIAEGRRCQAKCPTPLFYCATHIQGFYRSTPAELLRDGAGLVWACTSFTTSGLPVLACKDFESWGRLCNVFGALTIHGYRRDDEILALLLSSLLSLDSPWKKYIATLPRKGKTFEILTARLYLEELAPVIKAAREGPGKEAHAIRVLWDQRLTDPTTNDDRQIDVLIRWFHSSMSDVFTLVECKDTEVEVSDVEAFVTKIQDLGATNGVMASSVGFQSGAQSKARAHDIELRVIKEEDLQADTVQEWIYRYHFEPEAFFLEPLDKGTGGRLEGRPADYRLRTKEGTVSLSDFIDSAVANATVQAWPPAIKVETPDARLVHPDGHEAPVARLHVPLVLRQKLEQVALPRPRRPGAFSVHELIANKRRSIAAHTVPMLPAKSMEAGRFYANLLAQAYFCPMIDDDKYTIILLADYQHGTVLDVEGTQLHQYAPLYYPVEDPIALTRLRAAWERFKTLEGQGNRWA